MQNNFGGLAPLTPEEFRAQLLSAQEKTVTPAAGGDNHGSHNATTAEGASAYEEFLSNCRALNLKANTALLQRAEDIRSGSTVDLSRTYVGGAGLQAACTLLAQNRALRHLRLPQNGLYNDAVVYFCRSMKRHPTLETVDFSGNPQISLAGGLALLSLVHDNHPTLIELNVTGTRIPDAVLAKIQRALTANQEARMLLSSDDGSLVPSPLPHSPATTGMAKTLGAPYSPPSRTAAGHAAVKADGTTVFSNTYTAGRDPTNRKAVFTADHTGLSSSSAVVAASATATGYLRSATLSTQHNGSSRPTTSHLHDSAKPKSGPTASTAVLTQSGVPTARTREQREAARAEAWATREEQSLKRLQQQMEQYAALLRENNAINTLPPAEPTTRWRVLEVAILAPPAIFDSEIALLVNDVFPALNAELQSRRVALQPLVNPPPSHTTPATAATISGSTTTTTAEGAETAGQALRALQCVSAADVLPDVQRSRLAVIELIGDRPGHLRQPTEADMEAGATEMVPVLYHAHQEALACCQCIIAAIRRSASCMNIPPALAPLFSCEPRIEHPDKHHLAVKDVLLEAEHLPGEKSTTTVLPTLPSLPITQGAREAPHPVVVLDHEREVQLWARHQAFVSHVRQSLSASAELLVDGYKANFAGIDNHGAVHVTDLDEFRNAIYHRLRTVLFALFAPVTTASLLSVADLGVREPSVVRGATCDGDTSSLDPAEQPPLLPEHDLFTGPAAHQRALALRAYQTVADRLFSRIVESSPRTLPRKGIHNRLQLYLTTPPSRNLFLLHHPHEGITLTSTIAIAAVKQLFAKPFAYATALHSTRAGVLSEEPTDVREVMVHILSQLTTHPDVLRYLRCEVDVHRLKRFFINFLSGSQIRPDESQPAMLALSALGAGARPSQGTGKETGSGTATTVNVMTVPMPEITAKTLQHAARELVEDTTSKRSAHEVPAFTAEDANRIFVVLLDGLDDVVEPVEPCAALRQSPETGADEWSVAPATADGTTTSGAAEPEDSGASGKTTKLTSTGAHQSTNPSAKVKQAQLVSQEAQRISFLPACLARNVRLIATCTTDPAPHLLKVLTARGRDSVDTFAMPSTTVNETEMLLSPSALEPFGIALSDDGLVLARDKTDSQNPEYLHYLTDALRTHFDVPGSQTLLSLLKAFPATVDGAARRVHAQLRARFGDALVKNAIGLISASRWGLVESDLRALLQLPPKRFNEFLRVLRPALDSLERLGVPPIPAAVPSQTANGSSDHGPPHAEDTAAVTPATSEGGHFTTADSATVGLATQTRLDPNCSGNVIQRRIRLASPAFLRLLRQEELLADEEGSASAAEQRTWHQTLAQYYHAVVQRSLATERHQLVLSATPANGSERQAVKELIYHAARGGLWTLLDRVALSFPFMMLVYRHQLAYAYVRDLVFAFNTRHEAFLLGENEVPTTGLRQPSPTRPRSSQTPSGAETQPSSTAVASAGGAPATTVQREATLPTALLRMRSYIFFARQYSAYLTEFPHLVLQAALERSPSVSLAGADVAGGGGVGSNSSSMNSTLRMVQYEAADYVRRYFYWQPAAKPMPSVAAPQCGASAAAHNHARVFFRIANERKSRVHLGAVTACAFSPNSRYVVTGSTDRSVAWVQPATGSVLFHGRHSSARIRQVIFAETSAYVMAVAEDRTLYIYDTAFGKLVSRNDGAKFDSPIAAIQFSVRGRYYIVGLEDFTVHVFSTERSHLIGSVPAASWQTVEPANDVGSTHRRAHLHILPDPAEEKRVHVFANELVQSWSVDALGEGVECVTQAHRTSLSDSLASAQWYPVAAMVYRQFTTRAERSAVEDPQHREREEARHSLAVSGRYALLLPLHRAYVSLYDMASHTEVARAHPANLNGQCWRDDGAGVEASLSVGCPVTVVALAAGPSHGQWLAVAGSDGSVTLYDVVRCVTQVRVSRQLATATVNTLEPVDAPVHTCFAAFRASATHPRVVGLAFALDDTALVAISDSSHVLYWSLEDMDSERPSALAAGGEARWQAPLLDVGEAGHRPSPRNDADGEFRLDSVTRAPLTCWSARPTPRRATESASDQTASVLGEESAPLLALGDAEGQVVLLELWKPTA